MVVWSASQRPAKLAVRFGDEMFVDARNASPHQPVGFEFPVLVTISAKPLPAIVAEFVGEANSDAIVSKSPQFFDQPIIKLPRPLTGEKGLNGFAAGENSARFRHWLSAE